MPPTPPFRPEDRPPGDPWAGAPEPLLLTGPARRSCRPAVLFTLGAVVVAGALATGSAVLLTRAVEARSREAVQEAMAAQAVGWVQVETDGLQVILTGTAPTEAQRSRAISIAAGTVDPARVVDDLATADAAEIPPAPFALEILRNGASASLIGLVPEAERDLARDSLEGEVRALSDMLDTAAQPAPEGWSEALRFGLAATRALPRSKISIAPGRVTVTGSADTSEQQRMLEASLARQAPAGIATQIRITAPRPVLTPFALGFVLDGSGARMEACSADSEAAREAILAAAAITPAPGCTLGLGAPSPRWGEAAAAAIGAVHGLGAGSVTLSDTDVTLAAGAGADPQAFDRAAAELKARLPAPFSLSLVRPERQVELREGPAEITAIMEAQGPMRLSGRVLDERQRQAVIAYAQSRFGAGRVVASIETAENMPEGWGLRVLAGLEALSRLQQGRIAVRPELVEVEGVSGAQGAQGEIARLLVQRLGVGAPVRIAVRYDKRLDPQAALPSPDECVAAVNTILTGHKVTFAPGSATIEAAARGTLDALADALRPCIDVRMEIGGHTDSQGRDQMNLQLSQARAEAVLEALLARRVPVGNLSARGYGETQPIADNRTEDGRETNRRIEFRLLVPAGGTAGGAGGGAAAAGPQAGARPAPVAGGQTGSRAPAGQQPGGSAGTAAGTAAGGAPVTAGSGALRTADPDQDAEAGDFPPLDESDPMDDIGEDGEAPPPGDAAAEAAAPMDTDGGAAPGERPGAGQAEAGAGEGAGAAPPASPATAAPAGGSAGAGDAAGQVSATPTLAPTPAPADPPATLSPEPPETRPPETRPAANGG